MMSTQVLVEKEKEEQGEKQLRSEDIRLLTGRGHFVDDYAAENLAFMALVHSPFAHAKIKRIDLSKVRSSSEFIATLTGEDLVKEGVSPVSHGFIPPKRPWKRYHLALGEVGFVGEPVVAILAKDRASAEDLVDWVDVEYEQLPVVATLEDAKQGKVLVNSGWKDNLSYTGGLKKGDADKAISSAAYVINVKEGIRRQDAVPMETHSVVVSYDKERDMFEVFATVQSVHSLLDLLSSELKIPKEKFRVKVMDMGGGFGTKGAPEYPWTLLACLFAKKTGFTVKFAASRTEQFLESAPGRDEYCDLTLACDRDGKFVAVKASIDCDVGVPGGTPFMATTTVGAMPGPYEIPNLDLKVQSYTTNKMPVGPVRGAGMPEGCYFTERAIDKMAKKMGLDPIELRRRNVLSPKSPFSEDYQSLLDLLVKSADYEKIRAWRDDFNSRHRDENNRPTRVAGIGISLNGGEANFSIRNFLGGISLRGIIAIIKFMPRLRTFNSETARVTLNKRGEVQVYTGSSPHGQGHETAFAQLASEELGVPFEKVKVMWGDTTLIPRGIGTFGSRSASAGGSAVVDASRKLKAILLGKASKLLDTDRNSLDIRNGCIVEAKQPEKPLIGLGEIVDKLGMSEISADSKFAAKSTASHSSGVHLCALSLDTETGMVRIEKYVIVEDCGRIINKAIVEGQLHGGVISGVGGALLEKMVYDNDGNLLTSDFLNYSIPTSSDSPNIEIFHKVTPSSSLNQTKGVGESGTIASYAAIINALNDALSQFKEGAPEVNIAPAFPEIVHSALYGEGNEKL
ncbi:MAG TPA: xanthine dehydrogenase family protein molybdopterin-binding subunit [Nitrososphaerales archaeon]|nr:xanthine dehydrogenase family protein molybdopterin-binding subunit [Nitrososphaerales archaeon]